MRAADSATDLAIAIGDVAREIRTIGETPSHMTRALGAMGQGLAVIAGYEPAPASRPNTMPIVRTSDVEALADLEMSPATLAAGKLIDPVLEKPRRKPGPKPRKGSKPARPTKAGVSGPPLHLRFKPGGRGDQILRYAAKHPKGFTSAAAARALTDGSAKEAKRLQCALSHMRMRGTLKREGNLWARR